MLNTALRTPFRERLACTISEGCEATGLGRTKINELIDAKAIESMKVGRRRLLIVRSLLKLIEGEPSGTEAA